jgi:2,5-diketo-D-gluconate reductase A
MAGDGPVPAVPTVELHDGVAIPQLGFGVFQVPPEDTQETVEAALAVGYRHFDTATAYRNEKAVGAALAAADLPREELFVTTKLWNADHGRDATLAAAERSLDQLGLDQVDLYLIHWPLPATDLYVETWRAFEALKADGMTRSIGVSNFRVEDLERLQREAEQRPTVNQIELHPYLQQAELREWQIEHGVATEAWSPIAQGAVLDDETLATIAAHHERTVAQTVLRWHVQLGNIVIPKSVTPERIQENFASLADFELSEDEMATIARLDRGERTGPDPDTFDLK